MIALWLAATLGLAAECQLGELPTLGERTSVAWVSPLGQRVGGRRSLVVTPTRELAAFLKAQREPSVARLLQYLGERRSDKPPKRAYKVTILDVSTPVLCRPLADHDEGDVVSGLRACARGVPKRQSDGCGIAIDHGSKQPGPTLLRARWSDAARSGFCVLPAERFIDDSAK